MRSLLVIALVLSGAWFAWWFIGSTGVERGFAAWFEDRRADGWVAEYDSMGVKGFPNRFDTVFDRVELADPATGWAWTAPDFRLYALSYRPNHVIAQWPTEQVLATPLGRATLRSDQMEASLVVDAGTSLALARTNLVAGSLIVDGGDGGSSMTQLRLAAEREEGADATYRLGLAADSFAPALRFRRQIDPAGLLPDAFDALRADATVTFDRPWDRTAIEDTRPQPTRLHLQLVEAKWGALHLQAAGELDIDTYGQPTGRIVLKARNWRDILKLARASGKVGTRFLDTLEAGAELAAGLAGNPKTLDLPLDFKSGRIYLGPIPVAPAPVLRLR